MTLDPKKLEAAIEQVRLEHANNLCTIDGCTKLAMICDRAARADELERERKEDAEKMRLYSQEAAVRRDESHSLNILCDDLRAEVERLKAELARFEEAISSLIELAYSDHQPRESYADLHSKDGAINPRFYRSALGRINDIGMRLVSVHASICSALEPATKWTAHA